MLKDEGIGKQGHSRSPSDNARALLHVAVHQQQGLSYDAVVKATAQAELASPSTIRTWRSFFAVEMAIVPRLRVLCRVTRYRHVCPFPFSLLLLVRVGALG